jgi:hypothetical protein
MKIVRFSPFSTWRFPEIGVPLNHPFDKGFPLQKPPRVSTFFGQFMSISIVEDVEVSCRGHGCGDSEDVERASADDSPGAASAGPSGATYRNMDLMNYPIIICET